MGLWRDVNGDGNFQPGGADGAAFMTCVTAANRSMRLHRIGRGCLLGPGGVSARRWDLECHPRLGSGFELCGEQSRAVRGRQEWRPRRNPQRPRSRLHERLPDHRGRPRQRQREHGRLRQPPDEPVHRRRHLPGPVPHRPRPRPVRIDPAKRRGRLQERRHRLRQRPRGHQHRGRDRVLRGELLARGGLHQRPRRPIGGADQRDQQRLQQHGRRHQLGCRPVHGQWPVHRRLQTSSSWSRTATRR